MSTRGRRAPRRARRPRRRPRGLRHAPPLPLRQHTMRSLLAACRGATGPAAQPTWWRPASRTALHLGQCVSLKRRMGREEGAWEGGRASAPSPPPSLPPRALAAVAALFSRPADVGRRAEVDFEAPGRGGVGGAWGGGRGRRAARATPPRRRPCACCAAHPTPPRPPALTARSSARPSRSLNLWPGAGRGRCGQLPAWVRVTPARHTPELRERPLAARVWAEEARYRPAVGHGEGAGAGGGCENCVRAHSGCSHFLRSTTPLRPSHPARKCAIIRYNRAPPHTGRHATPRPAAPRGARRPPRYAPCRRPSPAWCPAPCATVSNILASSSTAAAAGVDAAEAAAPSPSPPPSPSPSSPSGIMKSA